MSSTGDDVGISDICIWLNASGDRLARYRDCFADARNDELLNDLYNSLAIVRMVCYKYSRHLNRIRR